MNRVAETDNLMYDSGLEVLHPGGWEKTEEMARACQIGPTTRVLDIGGGRGTTACRLARQFGCKVVAIDISPDMVDAARQRVRKEGLEHLIDCRQADAHHLPFEDEIFDVVFIECVSVLLDREKAFGEFRRVLKIGGYLGDLEMTYQRQPSESFARQLCDSWEGFTTMTLSGWEELVRGRGLEVVKMDDFSQRLDNIQWTMVKELGITGIARMTCNLLQHPGIAKGLMEWERIFKDGKGVIGYGYFVARKAKSLSVSPEVKNVSYGK